jgi:hypothetical protein
MLYKDKLDSFNRISQNAVEDFFKKCKQNQSDPNDLLLVILHGFFDESILQTRKIGNKKLSPYVFGHGYEGLANDTQYQFFHQFRLTYFTNNSREDYIKYNTNENPGWKNYYHIITQLELLVYLKFWESDFILKQLFNMSSNLLHGKEYDWYKSMKDSGKKNLIENQIIRSCKKRAPKFYDYLRKSYSRQIRNAAAHSQFWIVGDHINFNNYDPNDGHCLKTLNIEDWEDIFHRTIMLYNYLIKYTEEFKKEYANEVRGKHFGKRVRITNKGKLIKYEWLRLDESNDRWIWYNNWKEFNIKRFNII